MRRAARIFAGTTPIREIAASKNGQPGQRRPRVSIYVLVFALILVLIAPAVGFLSYIIDQQNRDREREVSDRGAQMAGEVAGRLGQEVAALKTMLAVFASSGWLEANELELLHRRARAALAGTGRHLIVLDANLRQLMNTRVAYGAPLGRTSDAESAAEVLKTGRPAVSDIFHGKVADAPVFNVLRPVALPDGRRRVLILTRNTASLKDLFSAFDQGNWSFAVLDGAGHIATESIPPGEEPQTIPAACHEGRPGFRTFRSSDGDEYVYVSGVQGADWSVCAWVGAGHVSARAEHMWTTLFTGTVVWIGMALAAAVLLSALISRSVATTARVGEALDAGREISIPPSFIAEIDDVRSALAGAAAERIRKDQRLQLLLQETVHRAKNQLALAASLVDLSARNASSTEGLKEDLSGRLLALSRSLDAMTGDDHDRASLGELIRRQLGPFIDDDGDRLKANGPDVTVSERAAQSLSLVLHELATNAAKYGGWSRPDGRVAIEWSTAAGNLTLDWSETGAAPGSPDRQGFGTTLVHTLIEKGLDGRIERRLDPSGLTCRIILPLETITR